MFQILIYVVWAVFCFLLLLMAVLLHKLGTIRKWELESKSDPEA